MLYGDDSERVSAQLWAGSEFSCQAYADIFYDVKRSAHGCPLADSAFGRQGPCGARVPYFVSPVVDRGPDDDEYMQINSLCRSDPAEDFELGHDIVVSADGSSLLLSLQRIPDDSADDRLCEGMASRPPADARVLRESGFADLPDVLQEQRASRVTMPPAWRKHAQQRQLRLTSCVRRPREARHCAAVAAEPPQEGEPGVSYAHLTKQQQSELDALLAQFPQTLSMSSDDMGSVPDRYADFFLRLPTAPGTSCIQRPYRLSHRELQEFERQLANLVAKGVVKKATAPTDFVSPVLFVPKPRDPEALRLCVDFRRLNAVTKRDLHALPDITRLLQQMQGSKYFTALDLSSGFWALPIAEEDQAKTAFTGPDGHVYVWRKAAMGLSNSPAAFQRFMSHVLRGVRGVSVYIDDITIYSRTWADHLRILREVLSRLQEAGLKVKFPKCVWAAPECRVLGSIVGQDGIRPDPEKTAAIEQLPVPKNVADVRSFLGATGHFHAHVAKYAEKSDPLRRLLKKGARFEWTAECQAAFETLKRDLVSDSVLRMPDVAQPFVLTTDWSKLAVGAVLSQFQPENPDDPASPRKEYVIAYASRALNPAESNYAPTEGECLALVWATRKFRQYLHGQRFTVRTDHAALKWLSTARFENSKLERWSMRLQEFTFDVEYLPGPENVVADHLSRHTHAPEAPAAACAEMLACAMARKAADVLEHEGDIMDPNDWSDARLQDLWASGDAEAIAHEPCAVCGETEGHAHMVICDTCNRPYHLQCCTPPRSEVPVGDWHCHLCDEAYGNAHEFERAEHPILFPREADPYHPRHADLIAVYVRAYERGLRMAGPKVMGVADVPSDSAREHATATAADAIQGAAPADELKRIRRQAGTLRLHPTQPDWYMRLEARPHGREEWVAIPPPSFRWGLIGAYHDRVGHGGINQTMRAMRLSFMWPRMREDVTAYIEQCHACQLQRLQHESVLEPAAPTMSQPGEHLHIDLAGPLPFKEVRPASPGTARRAHAPSTTIAGVRYVCLIVDYFTKAAELVVIPDKASATVARALHDSWLCRHGVPEWITSDNGQEFGGAFAHQLARFGILHVTISAYNAKANGAVERLVRTVKTMLVAKAAGAVHNWVQLVPQLQGEYMARVHTSTGFSPNQLVYGREIVLPPPIGELRSRLQPVAAAAALPPEHADASAYKSQRDEALRGYVEAAYDSLLKAQQRHLDTQLKRLRGRPRRRGVKLAVGDLAYLLVPAHGKGNDMKRKQHVRGPFVVKALPGPNDGPHNQTVTLRTTERVAGQPSQDMLVHRTRVARCTTVVDVLEKLLRQNGLPVAELNKPQPDSLAHMHTAADASVV